MTKHIFISYNRSEPTTQVATQLFKRIKVNLTAYGFAEPFFDTHSVKSGDLWKKKIDQALAKTTHFIALLSDHYWLSEYCRYELLEAVRLYEQHGTPRLLPVLTERMDIYALKIPPNNRSTTRHTPFPKIEHLGQITFLGPYDSAGELCPLDCSDSTKLSAQLFDLVQRIKDQEKDQEISLNSKPIIPPSPSTISFASGKLKIDNEEIEYCGFTLQANNVSVLEYREFLEQSNYENIMQDLPISKINWDNRKSNLLNSLKNFDDDMSGVNFWEALAYSRWKKLRLPTITEMQVAATYLTKNTEIDCDGILIEASSSQSPERIILNYSKDYLWTSSTYPSRGSAKYYFGGKDDLCKAIRNPGGQNENIGLSFKIRCAI